MKAKKTIYIIPGFRHQPTQKAYKAIVKVLKKAGYLPVPIRIPWKQTTISQNTEYFLKEYKKTARKKKYILGFSYGAMIAFLAATKVDVSGLILCSLSPFFKEDLQKAKKNKVISAIARHRYYDFSKLHSAKLAKKMKAKQVSMLYGAKEERSLIKRVTTTYNQISTSRKNLIRIKKTEHNIGSKKYLEIIHKVAVEFH